METSLISTFAGLSIVMGLLAGAGTLSAVRGIFTFLIFIGFAMSEWLGELGVNEYAAYFLGQIIIMGSAYLALKGTYPHALAKVKQELQILSGKCH